MKEIYGKYENGKMEFAPNLTLRHRMTRRWRRTSAKSAKLAATRREFEVLRAFCAAQGDTIKEWRP